MDMLDSHVSKGLPPLPLTTDSFEFLRSKGCYYVDKTLLIRDILASGCSTLLFTRPRRFGKSLALSMLQSFFEKTDEDTSVLFQGTDIEKAGARYMDHQGQYPVIILTLKDAMGCSADSIITNVHNRLEEEYERHLSSMERAGGSSRCARQIERFLSESASEDGTTEGLRRLCAILREFHGVAPVVLIDEYDAPIRP